MSETPRGPSPSSGGSPIANPTLPQELDTPNFVGPVERTNKTISPVESSSAGERELYDEFEHIVGFGFPDSEKDMPTYPAGQIVLLPGIAYMSHSFYQKHKKYYNKLAQLQDVSNRLADLDPDAIPAMIEWKANYFDIDHTIQVINEDIALLHDRTPIPQLSDANQLNPSENSSSSSSSRRTFVIRRHAQSESSSSSSSRRTFVIRRHTGSDDASSNYSRRTFTIHRESANVSELPPMQDPSQNHTLGQQHDAVHDATLDSALFWPSERGVFDLGIANFLESRRGCGAHDELPPITQQDVESAHRFWKSRCDSLSAKQHSDQRDTNILALYRLLQYRVEEPFVRSAMGLSGRVNASSSSVDSTEVEFYKTVVCRDPSYLI